jgi:tetratricopeptide (TPR) repeat protein
VYQNPPRAASSTRQHVYIARAPIVLLPRRNAALNAFRPRSARMSQEIEILPVFISSTWLDLRPEHEAAERAVNSMRETKYVGMKYFGARDENTRRASLNEVDRSRVYVGIIGDRYGSGITEDEYERASARCLQRFIYFKADASTPDDGRETDPEQLAKLAAFKQKLRAAHTVKEFVTPDDLAAQVTSALHRRLFDDYLTPKLRGALSGEVSRNEAQTLLDAVKDFSELSRELPAQLQSKGFNVSIEGDFVAGNKTVNVYNTPTVSAPPIPTLHQLRAPVGDFVGREKEINELLAAMRGGASAAISGISGMGGIGKTELAFYVAERLRDTYPDAQLVVDMRGTDERPRDPADALAACIRAFVGPEQRLPEDLEELTQIYRSVLEGRRALILLDNARDSAQTRPLMPPAGSALLVTSREVVALPGMKRVTLDQLTPAEACALLLGIAPRVEPDVADEICFLCGYLPLAIRAAGSLLDVTVDLDPADYVVQLRDERTRRELIGGEGVDLGVEASFGLSYSRLASDAARVFRRLAVFPASFDARADEAICEDSRHKHLSELLRRNLVRYNEETQRYSLHNLTRHFADSRMSDDEGYATRMRHAAYYLKVLEECSNLYLKGGDAIRSGLALFDVERRNIEAGQEWAGRHSSGDDAAARLCNEYPNAGAYVLHLRQHPREFISWSETALLAARQLKDRASEGLHLGDLGLAYTDLGEPRRAIEFHEQRLVIAREIDNRLEEGNALGSLGNAYADLGETRRAAEFHEQSLLIARQVGNARGEAVALSYLGSDYTALSEYTRAIEYHDMSVSVARGLGDRRNESRALGNLGMAYAALGETQRAIELFEQCLLIAREIGDRSVEGSVLFNLGLALDNLGGRARAIVYAEAALEIFEQIESPHAGRVHEQLSQWRGSGK